MKRLAMLTSALLVWSLAFAAPVLAQPAPDNDTYADRTVIAGLPFRESLETTKATTDADDDEANANCGAPATDASVWYELTPTSDGAVTVDVSESDYIAGVIVVTGSPGSFVFVTCAQGGVFFPTTAGVTYAILAFDDQFDGGGNGGTLVITVEEAPPPPPPPEVDVTVDPTGHFSTSGSATITGTVTCTGDAQFTQIHVQLTQRVGRFAISGAGDTRFTCDGTTQPWTVEVMPFNGQFRGGRATANVFATACNPSGCGEDNVQQSVSLRS